MTQQIITAHKMTGNSRVDQEADEPQRTYSLRSEASTDHLTGIRALISFELMITAGGRTTK